MELPKVGRALLVAVCFLSVSCSKYLVREYGFYVSGAVVDEDGSSIPDAHVELTLGQGYEVFYVTEVVRSATATTDADGTFQFSYIAHQREIPYTLTVRKAGFATLYLLENTKDEKVHEIRLIRQ